MILSEGLRVISPLPSGLGVARPRSEPRLLCWQGLLAGLAGRACWPALAAPGVDDRVGTAVIPGARYESPRLPRRVLGFGWPPWLVIRRPGAGGACPGAPAVPGRCCDPCRPSA